MRIPKRSWEYNSEEEKEAWQCKCDAKDECTSCLIRLNTFLRMGKDGLEHLNKLVVGPAKDKVDPETLYGVCDNCKEEGEMAIEYVDGTFLCTKCKRGYSESRRNYWRKKRNDSKG